MPRWQYACNNHCKYHKKSTKQRTPKIKTHVKQQRFNDLVPFSPKPCPLNPNPLHYTLVLQLCLLEGDDVQKHTQKHKNRSKCDSGRVQFAKAVYLYTEAFRCHRLQHKHTHTHTLLTWTQRNVEKKRWKNGGT